MSENLEESNKKLTREEACKILGLPEDADDTLVKQKYGALLRQYKHHVDEKGTTYDDLAYYNKITLAYDTVFNRTSDFSDDNPTSPIPLKIRRKFGKLATVIEINKVWIIAASVILLLGGMFIYQKLTAEKSDITIKFVGAYSTMGTSVGDDFSEKLSEKSEVIENARTSFFTVTTSTTLLDNDATTNSTAFLSQLMGGTIDVILIDKESFDVYVAEKAFLPLDTFVKEYENDEGKYLVTYEYESQNDDDSDVVVESGIYGVDISNTDFFDDLGLEWLYDEAAGQEKTMIFAIARTSDEERQEKSYEFLKELLK